MTDPAATRSLLALLVAAGLGLRHALDPDHLVAVTDLVAERAGGGGREGEGQGDRGGRAHAARVGFAWGLGHAISLSAAGLALIRLGWNPAILSGGGLERCVGAAIVLLGIRLFVLQRLSRRTAARVEARGRRWAFATGLVHGLAGSGGVTLALLPLVPASVATPALLVFAGMTCASMTLCALAFGTALARPGLRARFGRRGRRGLAVASIAFGIGYAALA